MTFHVHIVQLSRIGSDGLPPEEMLGSSYGTVDEAHQAARDALARLPKGTTYRLYDADNAAVDDRGRKFRKRAAVKQKAITDPETIRRLAARPA
jgi:hypothetical protein